MDDRLRQDWIDAIRVLVELWDQDLPQPVMEAAWNR